MKETAVTTAFAEPDFGKTVMIKVADSSFLPVGGFLLIGADRYEIIQVIEDSIVVRRSRKTIPAGSIVALINARS